jgi:hypothetical protein
MTTLLSQREETPREGRFLLAFVFASLGSIALVASWLAPNHYPPWTSFHGEAAAFAALSCFMAARLLAPHNVQAGRQHIAVLLIVLLVLLQWHFGQIAYFGDALLSCLYVAGFGLAWWLGLNSIGLDRERSVFHWLAVMVLVGAAVSVLVAALQWLRMEQTLGIFAAERGPDMRPFGNLAQPNHLATLSLMATVFAWALYATGTLKRWHLVSIALWFGLGVTMTESRSALLAGLLLGLFVLAKWDEVPMSRRGAAVAAWWGMLVALALVWPRVNEILYLQPARTAQLTHDDARQVMWHQAVAGIAESPWLGYGWRQSMIGQKAGATEVPGWLATDYAHNIALDLLLWVGVPLGLAMVAVVVWWLARAYRRLRGSDQVILFGALIPFLVHSLFEFPFAYAYFLFPAAWMLGALSRLQARPEPTARAESVRARVVAAALLVGFSSIAAVAGAEYLQAEEDYRIMRFELRRVGRTPADYRAPDLQLLTQLDELLKAGRLEPHAGMAPEEIERLRRASQHFGWGTLQLTYAAALGMNGRPQEATEQLRLLRDIYGAEDYVQGRRLFIDMQKAHPELASVRVP